MLFSSFAFIWIFLPVVLVGSFLLQRIGGNRVTNVFLLLASLFFYAWGEPVYVLLMLFSIAVNWLAGLLIEKTINRRAVLAADIVINLLLLGYFKYAGMAVSTWNTLTRAGARIPQIALPIGISFFTFQALSYVIDVYRNECDAQKNVLKLALYISFFPQLIAGPIVKYRDVAEQIDHRTVSAEQTAEGVRRFLYGFGKKILIANALAACADEIYALPLAHVSSFLAWTAAVLFCLQLYYDFSGYSDMAIGLGRMCGFNFKENFDYPYLSGSVAEFWRRWHISLGNWFREYLYIPLGGSRRGAFRSDINLLAVFFLTGLWHGASWNYVLWGTCQGLLILAERHVTGRLLSRNAVFAHVCTLFAVCLSMTVFRIESVTTDLAYLARMVMPWRYAASPYAVGEFINPHVALVAVLAVCGAGVVQTAVPEQRVLQWKHSTAETVFLMAVFALSLLSLTGNTYNPFIYFRF